ncbi:restriction endonuclease [candidate division KSB1 bacterium]|nr:restriction endonuclease [candidate division KSB1 bacterium]
MAGLIQRIDKCMTSAIKAHHEWAIATLDKLKDETKHALNDVESYEKKLDHLYNCFLAVGLIERDLQFGSKKQVDWSRYQHALADLLCSSELICLACGDCMEVVDDAPEYLESLTEGQLANHLAGFNRCLYCYTCYTCKNFIDERDIGNYGHSIPSEMLDAILLPKWPDEKLIWKIKHLFSDALHNAIAKDPNLLYELNPRRFEILIASILKEIGFSTTLTPFSKDGGFDIFARLEPQNNESSQIYLVECKKYKSSNKVGVRLIRELYGVKFHNSANVAMLVTTSSFTREARNFAKQHYTEIQLKDFNDIMNWIRKYINGSTTLKFSKSLLQNKAS